MTAERTVEPPTGNVLFAPNQPRALRRAQVLRQLAEGRRRREARRAWGQP